MSYNNVNKVIIVGNLGQTPELRYTNQGHAVANLSVATNGTYKNKEGDTVNVTEWHKATVWGKRAEVCSKYLSKGERVYLEGEIRSSQWSDEHGNKRKTHEILVDDIRFLGVAQDKKQTPLPDDFAPEMDEETSEAAV